MRNTERPVSALVGVALLVMVAGCTAGEGDAPASPPAAPAEASVELGDLLREVDWPDDEAGVTALLGPAAQGPDDAGSAEDGPTLFRFGESTVTATPEPLAPEGSNRAGEVLSSSAVPWGGPQNCVDARYSPLFADYFALGRGVPPGPLDREVWDASIAELERLGAGEAPDGLLWIQCTQVYDDYTGPGDLVGAARRFGVAWSDGEWVYSLREHSAEAREEAVRTLVDLAQE